MITYETKSKPKSQISPLRHHALQVEVVRRAWFGFRKLTIFAKSLGESSDSFLPNMSGGGSAPSAVAVGNVLSTLHRLSNSTNACLRQTCCGPPFFAEDGRRPRKKRARDWASPSARATAASTPVRMRLGEGGREGGHCCCE